MLGLKRGFVGIALLAASACGSASAASLSTDVSVNIPSSIALYCYDKVDVNISANTFETALARNGTRAMPTLTRTARGRANGRLVVNQNRRIWNRGRYRFRPTVNLDLGGVCAYHAIGGSNGARVTVEALEPRLEASGGAFINVQRVRARDSDNAGSWRRRYRVPASDLGAGVVRGIDVRLRLNLRNATEPGTYSSPVDGTFRITVIGNP